jgi:TM2 domain-containing membrane protein YozV
MVLEPRVPNESGFALLVFFIGALLIALARTFQRDVFVVLFKSSMLFRTSEDLAKDGEEMSNLASTFLTVHFFGIFSYVLFSKFNTGLDQFYLHLALPAYLLYLVIVTWLFTRLSSSDQLFREIQFYSFLSLQTLGILYLVILFIDHFSPFIPENKNLLLFLRILRTTVLALQERMRWYYIILYFWTLEILPVLAVIKLFYPELFREWIG